MAQKIKNFWLKFGAMFLTLYFMPLADFVMGLLGIHGSGAATAGMLECARETMDCPGTANRVMADGETAICQCTDRKKVFQTSCHITLGEWEDFGGFNNGPCYDPNSCTNGATMDCSTASQTCTKTCKNNVWGSCVCTGGCKNGYVMVGGRCYATCNIDNGWGYEIYVSESSSTTGV